MLFRNYIYKMADCVTTVQISLTKRKKTDRSAFFLGDYEKEKVLGRL